MTHRTFRLRGMFAAFLVALILLPAHFAAAQVHDNAKIFSADAIQKANAAMAQMKARHNKEFIIETFAAVPPEQQAELQQGKSQFFTKWLGERARADSASGVIALICMNPKYIEVGAGNNTRARGDFTENDVTRLREQLQSDFHGGQFDQGLSNAVDLVERAYTANISGSAAPGSEPPAAAGRSSQGYPSSPSPAPAPSHSTGFGVGIGSLVCLGVAVLLIVSLVHSVFSRRGSSNYGGGYGGGFGGGGPNVPMGGPGYGGPGYGGGGMGRTGGGFGSGLLGGLLGGAVGGYAADKWDHRNDPSGGGGNAGGGSASFPEPSGGGGGGFDSGPSDAGQGFDVGSSGGDFGGGGGDSGGGGGGGDSGGGF